MVKGVNLRLFDLNPKERKEELFDREQEVRKMLDLVAQRRWMIVLGQRMMGKSSLVKVVLSRLLQEGYSGAYVSLWGARSLRSFVDAMALGISASTKLFQKIKQGLKSLEEIHVGLDGFTVRPGAKPTKTLYELTHLLGGVGKMTIMLDEVQELSNVTKQLHAFLANTFSTYPNVVFIFTGSLHGVVRTILEPRAESPLYGRPPAKLELGPFPHEIARAFLTAGFTQYKVKVQEEAMSEALRRLNGVPGWLTLYGNLAAVEGLNQEKALQQTLKQGFAVMAKELDHFMTGRDKALYIAVLRAALNPARWSEIKRTIESIKMTSLNPATLNNALKALEDALFMQRRGDLYEVADPVVKEMLVNGAYA